MRFEEDKEIEERGRRRRDGGAKETQVDRERYKREMKEGGDHKPDNSTLFVVFSLSKARYVWLSKFFSLCPCRCRKQRYVMH